MRAKQGGSLKAKLLNFNTYLHYLFVNNLVAHRVFYSLFKKPKPCCLCIAHENKRWNFTAVGVNCQAWVTAQKLALIKQLTSCYPQEIQSSLFRQFGHGFGLEPRTTSPPWTSQEALSLRFLQARRASCTAPPFIWWRRGNQKVNREASGVQFNRDGSFFSIPSCKSLHNSSFQTQEQGPACMTSWDASLHTVEAGMQSLCNLMDGGMLL